MTETPEPIVVPQAAAAAGEHLEDHEPPPPGVRIAAIVRWTLVGLMAVAALGAVLHYFGAFETSGAGSRVAVQYHCPMHPSIVQDHPGDCPICGMTLVLREPPATPAKTPGGAPTPGTSGAPAPAGGSTVPRLVPVELTPERIQLAGIRTARVTRESLAPEIRAAGFVSATEQGQATINARFSGWIERLFVNQTGERVGRGQVLATIYSAELLAAQQEYLSALRMGAAPSGPPVGEPSEHAGMGAGLTAGLAGDARRRLELLGISRPEIDEIERTGQPVRALQIRSPVAGYVTQKNVSLGAYVQPGAPLFQIADLSTVWVLADIYEYEISRLRLGQVARLELTAYPGESFTGRVRFIYPALNAETRTLRVRAELPNPGLRLRPGLYGNVYLALDRAEGLVVPREAVVDTGDLQYVFLAREGGRFEPRRVRVGARSGERVEILDGVAEGDSVVTTANFVVDSESRLRAAIEGLGGGGAASGGPPSRCDADFDRTRFADKYAECRACETQHRGMGSMVDECINAIARPWR